MPDIFVAYTSRDSHRVRPLVEALKECGWDVWWADETRVGAKIDEAVGENIEAAGAVVAVMTSNTHESDWFFSEAEFAMRQGTLFPVLLDEIELPRPFTRIRAAEFAGWSESPSSNAFQKLASSIAQVLGAPPRRREKATWFYDIENDLSDLRPDTGEEPRPKVSLDDFRDPTVPFPAGSGASLYRFDEEGIESWLKGLRSRRLIAVRSPDDEITSAAVDCLLRAEELSDYEARLLAFGATNQERSDLFLENLVRQDLGKPNQATIVVVDPHGALPFIDSILGGPHQAEALAMEMKWRDLLIIVQIGASYQRDLHQRFDTFRFPCFDVPFLKPLLERHFPDGKAHPLLERLLEQRRNGLWGSPHDNLDFYEILQTILSGKRDTLQEELDRRETDVSDGDASQVSLEAFRTGPPYYRAILLCGAFFRGLDVREFKKLCLTLVGESKIFVPDSRRDKSGHVMSTSRETTLVSEWPIVADEIFRKCGLIVRDFHGSRAVSFERPEDRSTLAEYIEDRANYFSETATKLWDSGFLFERDASTELVDGLTALFVANLRHDKTLARQQWLSDMLIRQLSDGASGALEDLLHSIAIDDLVLSRTGLLLRALLADPDHSRLVKSWLDDLLSRRGHFQALRLATHLRYTDEFDYLFWLKRFSDESPDEVRSASYSALYQHARQSGAQIWDLFRQLESWMPSPAKSANGHLSNSNHFSLRLIIQYSFDTANELEPSDIGSWPPRYPLFRDFALEEGSSRSRLTSLMSWLFHPAVSELFQGDSDSVAWAARGQMISLWSYILLGLETEFTHGEALKAYEQILELCWRNTNAASRDRLFEAWLAEIDRYRNESLDLDGEGYRYFAKRIHLVERLMGDFRDSAPDELAPSSRGAARERWNTAQ